MKRLTKKLLYKINKSDSTSISMRFRLFLFLLVLVITMLTGIIVILLVTGTFSAGLKECKQDIKNELKHTSAELEEQYGQLSVQAVEFSEELSKSIEEKLQKQNLTFSSLSNHPELIDGLISGLFEKTYFWLQKSNCSGTFFILDTTVNTSLEDSNYSKAGLYIKNMEPNIVNASSPTITILRGSASIGRENYINLHTQWSMEFDVNGADYYSIPLKTAQNSKNRSLSELYYWSKPFTIPGTSEEVMLCTVPLMDSNKNIYGICGFEISAMLFKLSYMPRESSFTRMFCMLSPLFNHTVAINQSMFAGGYSVKDISEGNSNLTVKESHHSFTTYSDEDKNSYLGFHSSTKLYPEESPFASDSWIIAVLVPKKDVVNYITRLNIILAWLLTLLVTIGIIISIVFSNNYLKPISQGIEIIKSTDPEDMPKTNVQEIDDLIRFLTVYKKELNDKVERDKFQITVLEHFVEKTKMLSPAERSVFHLYVKGLNAREIADEMFLSINTIKTHSKHIFSKLEISSREELLLYINMLKEIGQEFK